MNIKRMSFLILLVSVLLPSAMAVIDPARIERVLAIGSLGHALSYTIYSLNELKVGNDTSVDFEFVNGAKKIYVTSIWVQIVGAEINSTGYGINKRLAAGIELDTFESVNETVSVKPLAEGKVSIQVRSEYNWTDFYGNQRDEWGDDEVFVYAKVKTYDDLLVSENNFRNLTYILSITTIAFLATTIYLVIKQKMKQT